MEARKDFITELELYRHTDQIKRELKKDIRDVAGDVKTVAQNVDSLEKTVLPIAGILNLIEQNTRETSSAIKELAKEQKELTKEQKRHTEKLFSHDNAINELQRDDDVKLEKEKGKWGIMQTITTCLLSGGGILAVYGKQIAEFLFGGK
jgi:hypothetical protein